MPKCKPHIEELYRTQANPFVRKDYLRLDMNENPDGLPDEFVNSVLAEVDADFLSTYPSYGPLLEAISRVEGVPVESVCLANGSDGAIRYLFDAFVSPGDRVLLTDPTFGMYPVNCRMYRAEPVMVPYEKDLSFSCEKFLAKIDPSVKMAVLVNPNNPTGTAIELDKVAEVLDKCLENDVVAVVDEAYYYYHDETVIRWIEKYPNLIVLRTFSKLCGLAALRVGYAACGQGVVQCLKNVRATFDVNYLGAHFARRVLENEEIVRNRIDLVMDGKRYLESALGEMGLEYRSGSANSVLIRTPVDVEEMVARLKEKMVLVSGGFSHEGLKGFLRVTIGSRGVMERFLKAFKSCLEQA